MSIVNCKVSFLRPLGYNNLQEWINDPNNIYVGRAGIVFIEKVRFPKTSSIFANPYKVGSDGTREEVIQKYETYIRGRLQSEPALVEQLRSMKGKTLGCWCKPEACHGDVLLRLMNEY